MQYIFIFNNHLCRYRDIIEITGMNIHQTVLYKGKLVVFSGKVKC